VSPSTRTAKLADEMRASLTSPTLAITPVGVETQLLRRSAPTEWRWNVVATTGGAHILHLALYAIPPGRASGVQVQTFSESLQVHVPFTAQIGQTLSDNWEWMWTFIIGPIGALAWRRYGRRRGTVA